MTYHLKQIGAAFAIALALPGAAYADDDRRDRRDVREERRELDRAWRYGDRDDVREEYREYRDAKREYRDDRRDDWRDDRRHGWHNGRYQGGHFRAPFRYRSFQPGWRISPDYYARSYHVSDYSRYRIARPGYYQRWVRHYDDLLLIDTRSGRVLQVRRNFYW